MNDAKLDELYENREQDEVPEVAPPTDEEMEAMYRASIDAAAAQFYRTGVYNGD